MCLFQCLIFFIVIKKRPRLRTLKDYSAMTFSEFRELSNFSIMRQFDDSFNLIQWDSSSFVALGIRH